MCHNPKQVELGSSLKVFIITIIALIVMLFMIVTWRLQVLLSWPGIHTTP